MSSGSLHSSSVSLSSSTDCLEEFQGDAPFAGTENQERGTEECELFDIEMLNNAQRAFECVDNTFAMFKRETETEREADNFP